MAELRASTREHSQFIIVAVVAATAVASMLFGIVFL
jgi:hypothetical protein